jgi:peptide/nickel transport system substrate-binding protein
MRARTTRLTGLIALAAASALVVGACSNKGGTTNTGPAYSIGYSECQTKPDTCNTGPRKDGGEIRLAIGKKLPNFNVNSSQGNLVETVEVMNLIQPSAYIFLPSGALQWNKDLFVDEPKITTASPQTVVYHIRPEAKWDDGTAISADDFTYAWKTNNGHDAKLDPAGTTGYDQVKSITGSDNGKTVTVVFDTPYPDFAALFGQLYPSHIAAKAGDLSTDAGLEAAWKAFFDKPDWTGGPYKISNYDKDTQIEFVKNPNWFGADKPTLDKITFKFITDPAQQLPALKNKEIDGFNVQPNLDLYNGLQGLQGVNYEITPGYTWEHIDINTKAGALSDQVLRTAIFDVIDRQAIIDKTVKPYFPAAKPLGSHNFVDIEKAYKDILTQVAPDQGNGKIDAAKKALTDAGYTLDGGQLKDKAGKAVGPFRLVHTGTKARGDTSAVVQQELKQIGITITDTVTDDLSGSIDSKNFDLILFAWAGNPLKSPNVANWTTGSGNNTTNWGDSQVDQLMKQSATELDQQKVYDLQNQADEILTKAAVVLPLYTKPNIEVSTDQFVNIRDDNSGSYFTYNSQQWGLKA